jgi:hypothetical protein
MNNAKNFVLNQLKGLSITFKPVEKGKDRPVQTMTFNEFTIGQFGLEVDTTIVYTTKNSQNPTTARRLLSLARVMEYVAQAAEQSYVDAENLPSPAPATSTATPIEEVEEVPEVAEVSTKKGKRQRG